MLYFSSDNVTSFWSSSPTGRGKVVGLGDVWSKAAVPELGSLSRLICGWQGAVCQGGSSSRKSLHAYKFFYFVLVMGTAIQWFAEFVVKSVCGVVVVAFYIF